jgi:hypothetical protein
MCLTIARHTSGAPSIEETLLVTFTPIVGILVGKLCSALYLYVLTVRTEAHRR